MRLTCVNLKVLTYMWLATVGCWVLGVGRWRLLLVVGGWWLAAVGCWVLVAGWLLAAGCWWLVVGCCWCVLLLGVGECSWSENSVGSAAGCRRRRNRTKRKALQLSAMGAAVAAGAQKLRGVRSADFLLH